jgi:hypothetical protein
MRKLLKWRLLVAGLIFLSLSFTSCGSPDYKVFSLKEGIGHFSFEYPAGYSVTRIDIRNEAVTRYTDIGLCSTFTTSSPGLNEISVYAWPVDSSTDTATHVLTGMLAQGETIFSDFKLDERFSVMIGDMEGQAAIFSWTASSTSGPEEKKTLPAISRMVCFRHGDLAWEIHVASGIETQVQAETEFNHILETFQILN